ncbi:uncharacterized protein [Diadema antillarum]|uniref:uncharacterized protein n=1 Tax=Diadema antillarum TaxID=105358 RepID=UPI003A8AEDA6
MPARWGTCLIAALTTILTHALVPAVEATPNNNTSLYTFTGCFYDNPNYDVLPDLVNCTGNDIYQSCSACSPKYPYCQSGSMTVELCFDICVRQNARYFGLQDGSQCLCGGAFARFDALGTPTSGGACEKPCTGNASQSCGGSFTLRVYEIQESTSDCFHPGYLNVREDHYPPLGRTEFAVNDVLDYATICRDPSVLAGDSSTISCNGSAWSAAPPPCDIRCSRPDMMPYVYFAYGTNDSYGIGETETFLCTGNLTTFQAECTSVGLWELPIDCPVTCPDPSPTLPIGGALDASATRQHYPVGVLLNFECDDAALSFTIACGDDGSWNISGIACPNTTQSTPTASSEGWSAVTSPMSPVDPRTMSKVTVSTGTTTALGVPGETNGQTRGGAGWIIAVAVVIPLLVIIVLVIACICYRKRKEEESDVPQVVLGYIKKTGTLGGTLRRNKNLDVDATNNIEGGSDTSKRATLSNSLSSIKREFVKRVTLNRNRPDLPPKKNPKRSSSQPVSSGAPEGIYDSPREVRANSNVSRGKYDNANNASRPSLSGKKASTLSTVPSFDNEDDVFKPDAGSDGRAGDGGLRTSKSNEMLDALMMEYDGRVNLGFDDVESSARSSPSMGSMAKDSPITERAVVHAVSPLAKQDSTDLSNPQPEDPSVNGSTADRAVDEVSPHRSGGAEDVIKSKSIHLSPLEVDVHHEGDTPRGDDPRDKSPLYASIGDPNLSPSKPEIDDTSKDPNAQGGSEVNGTPEPPRDTSAGSDDQGTPASRGTSLYDTLGKPKPLPPDLKRRLTSESIVDGDENRPPPLTIDTSSNGENQYMPMNGQKSVPGPESPQYASLSEVRTSIGGNSYPEVTSPLSPATSPLNHGYVNVGRGNMTPRANQEFVHPRRPSLPPDSPV